MGTFHKGGIRSFVSTERLLDELLVSIGHVFNLRETAL